METDYMRILDKYAGRYGRAIFWLFILLGVGALMTPILINLRNIWENIEWIILRVGGEPLVSSLISLVAIIVTFLMLIGFAWATGTFLGMVIRVGLSTPTHWHLQRTLQQFMFILQTAKMQGHIKPDDMGNIEKILKDTEELYDHWQGSRSTRFVGWLTRGKKGVKKNGD
jgi:hypothetical protein